MQVVIPAPLSREDWSRTVEATVERKALPKREAEAAEADETKEAEPDETKETEADE